MPFRVAVTTGRLAQLLLSLSVIAGAGLAQDKFPARPVKIVVGSEAGSAPDALARAVAHEMGPLLGQSVIVDNKPGAAGTIGAASVVGAPADGYTVLMGTVSNVALAPSFYPVRYDPIKSFTPIGMVASVPLVLVAAPGINVHSYAQLQAKAKQGGSAGPMSYASPGVGGPQHLAGVLLGRQLEAQLLHVPYKSGGAAIMSVAAGEVQLAFVGIPAAASLIQAKKVIPILVTSSKRSSALADVPSAQEAGLPGFEIDNWHALLAPANLAPAVSSVLEAALQKALASPSLRQQFQKVGAEPAPGSSKQLEATVASETRRWTKVVEDNKLKAE
jgi:tripartite-type tricarboxylate transporter receptor subunit TctC